MEKIYISYIAQRLQVKDWQVENCVSLFDDGATIPFISRYRKERTGGLDYEPLLNQVVKRGLSPVFICESAGTQDIDELNMQNIYFDN